MSWRDVFVALWTALNSPAGVAALAGLMLWILNRIYARKPAWQEFEGTIIAAVKWAEKAIPDDTPNKSMARLDEALRYVVKVYQEARGVTPDERTIAQLREGIQIIHADLEVSGNLDVPQDPPGFIPLQSEEVKS